MSKLISGINDLATTNPDLAAEWHPTLNGDLKPSDVPVGTDEKVWWLGKCGHEWQARISHRNKGVGCPYCSNQKILPGFNDFATTHPEFAAEWHPTKNGELKPSDVIAGSGKKVWWLGKCGHEWQVSPGIRTGDKTGCPYCANKKVLPGFNDLVTTHPELAAEWHPTKNGELKPSDVVAGSNKKAWWLCDKRHEWQAVIASRKAGCGCPYCATANARALKGFNDLATVHPELAAEWHPTKNGELKPSAIMPGTPKKVWWQCSKGHEYQATPNNRKNNEGCPYCSNRRLLPGYNDLATVNPELAAEWHPTLNGDLKPSDVIAGSNKKAWWLCDKGHEWQAQVDSRNRGCGCSACQKEKQTSFAEQTIFFYLNQISPAENRYLLNGKTEIDIYIPAYKIGVEYDGYYHKNKQKEDTSKSRLCAKHGIRLIRIRAPGLPFLPVECIVLQSEKDNELEGSIQQICSILEKELDINIDRDRAQIHDQYIEFEKANSLATLNPELAAEWHPTKNGKLTPDKITLNSNKKVWWLCDKGHEWQAAPNHRAKRGCPYCCGYKVWAGFNDLATIRPDIAAEWHPTKNGELTPEQVTRSSHKKVWWLGKCGHEWQTTVHHRDCGNNCPICAGKQVLPGYNDLLSKNPELAAEWHPTKNGELKPSDVIAGSNKKAWWLGKCGHEWQINISHRNRGSGCPYCCGYKVWAGFNDLATIRPDIAAEWHPTKNGNLKPSDVSYGSGKKVWWLCDKGHEWQAKVADRHRGYKKCLVCTCKKGM